MRLGYRHVLVSIALAGLGQRGDAQATGKKSGALRVEFLYAIEHSGGRGERLREPVDIALDRRTGELLVVDAASRQIHVYDRNGLFVQSLKVNGSDAPRMVAVDGEGRIYVGHMNSTRVSLLDFRGQFIDTLLLPGVVDVPGATVRPTALASGPDGAVYALKSAGGIVKIDPQGESHEEIRITGEARPSVVYGLGIDPAGRLLFTDMRPYSVVVFDRATQESRRFGSPGVLHGQLDRPIAIAADEAGRMFVVSVVTNKVSCFALDGTFIEEFGGIGQGYGRFYMPSRIASDGKDRVYVLENALKRIQVFRVQFPNDKGVMRPVADSARPDNPS